MFKVSVKTEVVGHQWPREGNVVVTFGCVSCLFFV